MHAFSLSEPRLSKYIKSNRSTNCRKTKWCVDIELYGISDIAIWLLNSDFTACWNIAWKYRAYTTHIFTSIENKRKPTQLWFTYQVLFNYTYKKKQLKLQHAKNNLW